MEPVVFPDGDVSAFAMVFKGYRFGFSRM